MLDVFRGNCSWSYTQHVVVLLFASQILTLRLLSPEKSGMGLCLFRLEERLHQYHGKSIHWCRMSVRTTCFAILSFLKKNGRMGEGGEWVDIYLGSYSYSYSESTSGEHVCSCFDRLQEVYHEPSQRAEWGLKGFSSKFARQPSALFAECRFSIAVKYQ